VALFQRAGDPAQHHSDTAAAKITGTQPGRKYLAVHARQLALQQDLQILQRHPRSLLLRMEPTLRSAMENYVNRTQGMGLSMILFAAWYNLFAVAKITTHFNLVFIL